MNNIIIFLTIIIAHRREIELEYAKKLNALVKSVKVGDAGYVLCRWAP